MACSLSYRVGHNNSLADTDFILRGDGEAYADGAWNGSGADLAEYFEWADGNPLNEDRRGISVVLVAGKIRPALPGETPFGVISANPTVVGDAAWNKWEGKYLRDEFGGYLRDAAGDRIVNPAFDPDRKYVAREDRREWGAVGLFGKVNLRKGQPVKPCWEKMWAISETVERWFVC